MVAWVNSISSGLVTSYAPFQVVYSESFDKRLARNGFRFIFTLRLIPLVPFNGLNIGAGLSMIKYRDYALGTLDKYQENFNHKVRQKVGAIRNFVTYRFKGLEEGALIFFSYENDVDQYDADIVKSLVGYLGSLHSISIKEKEKERLQYLAMTKLAYLAEKRDIETGKHLLRVQNYCRLIAEKLST